MKCPVCRNDEWLPYISLKGGSAFTTDHRIIKADTVKVRCNICSCVRSENILDYDELEKYYSKSYILNTTGNEEHRFFNKEGSKSRSEAVFEWLKPFIPKNTKALLEVGCGEGNLLVRFTKEMPEVVVKGFDGSVKAVALAKAKGLDVCRKYIKPGVEVKEFFDIIIASGVIEHLVNINSFIHVMKESLKPNGRIIITLPVQDVKGYDIFFFDHVWHLMSAHMAKLLSNNGLKVMHHDHSNHTNHGMGLFICEATDKNQNIAIKDFSTHYLEILDGWNGYFASFNKKLEGCVGEKIVIFGASEFCTFMLVFTHLKDLNIVACIDETREKLGTMKHGMVVHGLDWFETNSCDSIVLAISPKYYGIVKEKIKGYANKIVTL